MDDLSMDPAVSTNDQSPLRILVISDSREVRATYHTLLTQGLSPPVNILEATPGPEAFKLLEEGKPDYIFVESAPCATCLESPFISALKSRKRVISIPIFFLRDQASQDRGCASKSSCTPKKDIDTGGLQLAPASARLRHRLLGQLLTTQGLARQGSERLVELLDGMSSTRGDLREEHRLNRALLSSLTSILIGLDGENRIGYWNRIAEKTFGLSADAVLERPLREIGIIWNWDSIEASMTACRKTHQTTRLLDLRYRLPAGNGGLLGFTVNWLAPHRHDHQELLLLGADITERRALEARLQQTQKLESVGQLAAGIAHELNTPIQYMGDTARFLKRAFNDAWEFIEKVKPVVSESNPLSRSLPQNLVQDLRETIQDADLNYLGEEIPKAIDEALAGLDHMAKIVHAMREYSYPGEGKTRVDINKIIESTLVVGRGQWKQVAEIETNLAPDLPELFVVASGIKQVLLNILVNAIHSIEDARKEGSGQMGQITINTLLLDQWVEININDTGLGIPDNIKSNVFDPFFTTKEIGEGTGQGLSIAHDIIVKKHAGKISFDSVEGQGTLFQIHLPLEDIADAGRG